jgi:hypothetical protein
VTDVDAFTTRFRGLLLDFAAESRGVAGIEAYRQWQTNPTFKAQIEAIVRIAVAALQGADDAPDNRLSEIFSKEANGLLGWDVTR